MLLTRPPSPELHRPLKCTHNEVYRIMTSDSLVADRRGEIRWMNQTFYYEAPFDLDEIVSITAIDGQTGYCDCCNERVVLTWRIMTFAEDEYIACEDCGRKVQRVVSEINSFK